MIGPRHEIARLQSDFYRDQFRKLLRWLIIAISLIFLLLFIIIYLILFQQPQKYYANTVDGKIIQLTSYKLGVR